MILLNPTDHLPQSVRDIDCVRRDEAGERIKAMNTQAKRVGNALRTVTEKQRKGGLSRSEALLLSLMIKRNLQACAKRSLNYRPTRVGLAKESGYDERTVSRGIKRLSELGMINIVRYAKGGRVGRNGKGLSTEFLSGNLQDLTRILTGLGYKLGKSLQVELESLANWCDHQVGVVPKPAETDVSTETKCPGTFVCKHKPQRSDDTVSPEPLGNGDTLSDRHDLGAQQRNCLERVGDQAQPRQQPRPILSNLARRAMPCRSDVTPRSPTNTTGDALSDTSAPYMVPMPPFVSGAGTVDGGLFFSLPKNRGKNHG